MVMKITCVFVSLLIAALIAKTVQAVNPTSFNVKSSLDDTKLYLAEHHGQTVHFPAIVVPNPKRKEAFRYIGNGISDRMPIANFAEELDLASAEKKIRETIAFAFKGIAKAKKEPGPANFLQAQAGTYMPLA